MSVKTENPFGLTKANDLSDDQIQELWVDVGSPESPTSLFSAGRFSSPMPTFILGGKGSGKTHLMRYASYPLQKLRYQREGVPVSEGLKRDRYVGIYIKCTGLETGRFLGKGQTDEAWLEVFSYYLEISCALAVLALLQDILADRSCAPADGELCLRIRSLFNVSLPTATNLGELAADLNERRKALDFKVSDAAFTGQLRPEISVSRGRLIFGLPRLIHECIPALDGVLFAYQLDEFENLTLDQQRHVNTLVRDREGPATFKIGARQFGIRTRETLSAREENIKDSEFDELRLDQRFRNSEKTYEKLVVRLVERRLEAFWPSSLRTELDAQKLSGWFAEPETGWTAERFAQLAGTPRKHIAHLRSRLLAYAGKGVPGITNSNQVEEIIGLISNERFPLLEKLNTTLIFNAWAKNRDLLSEASQIADDMRAFVSGEEVKRYRQKLDHYKSDIMAQMIRDDDGRQEYAGLSAFTRMSEGQPRALITLLKQTFDWASFQGERPFQSDPISVQAQSRGAVAAAEWFYNSMRNSGEAERAVLTAVDRLAELFRINRYADNPIECSLIGFSANYADASPAAADILKLAVDRSFIVEILGGQSERNSEQITTKYQLNRMLVPRWGLPTGRRGIKPFGSQELNAVFDPSASPEFEALRTEWRTRMNAPFQRRKLGLTQQVADSPGQSDLFG